MNFRPKPAAVLSLVALLAACERHNRPFGPHSAPTAMVCTATPDTVIAQLPSGTGLVTLDAQPDSAVTLDSAAIQFDDGSPAYGLARASSVNTQHYFVPGAHIAVCVGQYAGQQLTPDTAAFTVLPPPGAVPTGYLARPWFLFWTRSNDARALLNGSATPQHFDSLKVNGVLTPIVAHGDTADAALAANAPGLVHGLNTFKFYASNVFGSDSIIDTLRTYLPISPTVTTSADTVVAGQNVHAVGRFTDLDNARLALTSAFYLTVGLSAPTASGDTAVTSVPVRQLQVSRANDSLGYDIPIPAGRWVVKGCATYRTADGKQLQLCASKTVTGI